MRTDHLLFGAAYYLEYLPYDRLETDMEMMERAGMNTIRIAESTWSTLEPSDGVFDFTCIDRMVQAAAKHHLSVIIGTPTYAIPTWLARKYPDILAVTANGQELYGHRQNMDITHPGYRYHAERVIRAIMEHLKDVPNIIGFQLDNETKSYGTAGPRVQQMFVASLKKKYPDEGIVFIGDTVHPRERLGGFSGCARHDQPESCRRISAFSALPRHRVSLLAVGHYPRVQTRRPVHHAEF